MFAGGVGTVAVPLGNLPPPCPFRTYAVATTHNSIVVARSRPARHRRAGSRGERAVDGKAPVKRNRFITLSGATKSVNRQLEAKTRALAGWKGYADVGVMPTGDVCCLVGVVPGLDSSA